MPKQRSSSRFINYENYPANWRPVRHQRPRYLRYSQYDPRMIEEEIPLSFREYQSIMYQKYLDQYYHNQEYSYYRPTYGETTDLESETEYYPDLYPEYDLEYHRGGLVDRDEMIHQEQNQEDIYKTKVNNQSLKYPSRKYTNHEDGLAGGGKHPSYTNYTNKPVYNYYEMSPEENVNMTIKREKDLKSQNPLLEKVYQSSIWLEKYKSLNYQLDQLNEQQTGLLKELDEHVRTKELEKERERQMERDMDKEDRLKNVFCRPCTGFKKASEKLKDDRDNKKCKRDDEEGTTEQDGEEDRDDIGDRDDLGDQDDRDKTIFYDSKNYFLSENTSDPKKTELCFCLPLDNSNLKKPETSDGLLQMFFPNLTSPEEKEETEASPENSKRRERAKFINGEPIDVEINTLDDLITLANKIGEEYTLDKTYSLDLESLLAMKPTLEKLNNMIGLLDIKKRIVHQILFYLQGLDDTNRDMLHTVIEGDPGVGKTEIAKILGEIYGSLGILSKGSFKSVKRADLIGSYLGQTASKTLKVLEEAKGGVLFIDEAYSLGNEEGKDIYSKECIDTITAFLSENREDFVCIIAGYKEALRQCFFKYNAGLERRFPWTYTIKSYTEEELKLIFEKMVNESGWKSDVELKFFKEHIKKFKHFGGDMENLFHKSKLAHSFRSLALKPEDKKKITMDDINYGMKLFVQDEEDKKIMNFMMYT